MTKNLLFTTRSAERSLLKLRASSEAKGTLIFNTLHNER